MNKGPLIGLYRHGKVGLNYLFDRVIEQSNMVLMDVYRLPGSMPHAIASKMARRAGDIGWLMGDFPRLSAHKLVGRNWTIVFVGADRSLPEIRHLLFSEDECSHQELGRVALWRLSAQAHRWLAEGTDLVICELGRAYPSHLKAPVTFVVPTWIQQVLTIPEPLESLIAGKKFATERHRLNKARRAGFGYRFSQSIADFDHFHYHMYLPYVETRHGDLAIVAGYRDQRNRWFTRGGLVLVTHFDQPVAGVLCYMAGDTCFDVERGVLEADPQLLKQGVETIATWYAVNWARGQGAKVFDMGVTRAWRSNGSFNSKRRWGARVVRRKSIYGTWTFLGRQLPSALQSHLDRLGFISEIDGRFYRVMLDSVPASPAEIDVGKELSAVKGQGLDGLVVISANSRPAIYECV